MDEVEKNRVLLQRAVQVAALYGGPKIASYLTESRQSAFSRVQHLRQVIQSRLNNDANTPEMLLDRRDIPAGKRKAVPYSEIQLVISEASESPLALIEYRLQDTPDTGDHPRYCTHPQWNRLVDGDAPLPRIHAHTRSKAMRAIIPPPGQCRTAADAAGPATFTGER